MHGFNERFQEHATTLPVDVVEQLRVVADKDAFLCLESITRILDITHRPDADVVVTDLAVANIEATDGHL